MDDSVKWGRINEVVRVQLDPTCNPIPSVDFDWVPSDEVLYGLVLTPNVTGGQRSEFDFAEINEMTWSVEGLGEFPAYSDEPSTIEFPGPGEYPVTLSVWDSDGGFDETTKTVTVPLPFSVSIDLMSSASAEGKLLPKGKKLSVKEPFSVFATFAVSDLLDAPLRLEPYISGEGFSITPDGRVKVTDPPPGSWTGGIELSPGDHPSVFVFSAQAVTPGAALISTDLPISDATGRHFSANAQKEIQVGDALAVTVTPEKPEFQLDVDLPDNRYIVKVTVENKTNRMLTNVRIEGGLVIGSIAPGDPRKNSHLVDPIPDGVINSLGPKETSEPIVYHLQGLRPGTSTLKALAIGALGSDTVTSLGEATVKIVSDVWLEFRVKPENNRVMLSGNGIRLNGSIKNTSEDKTIGVAIFPIPDGNAGGGVLFERDKFSQTPDMPQGFLVPPGEEVELFGILRTLRAVPATDAKVDYTLVAVIHNDDGTKTDLSSDHIKDIQDNEFSNPVVVRLLPNPPPPDQDDPSLICGPQSYFLCGVLLGVRDMAVGTFDFVRLLGNGIYDVGYVEYRMLALFAEAENAYLQALLGDKNAMDELVKEVEAEIQPLVQSGAIALEAGKSLPTAIRDAMVSGIDRTVRNLKDGNLEELQLSFGEAVGQNADSFIFEPLVAGVSMGKALKGVAEGRTLAREALEAAEDARKVSLEDRIAEAIARGKKGAEIPKAGAFVAGDKLTAEMIQKYWGVSATDLKKLFEIADEEEVLLAFRARQPESISLLDRLLAWPKMQANKVKTINDIDLKYLDYPTEMIIKKQRVSSKGIVRLVEPPVNPVGLTEKEFEAAIDLHMQEVVQKHPEIGADGDLYARVRARIKTRGEEWPIHVKKYTEWENGKGIPVGFGYEKQGIGNLDKGVEEVRKVRVTTSELDDGRKVFDLEIAGPKGTDFRPLTGDVDFLAILNRDGTLIQDLAKRVNIYKKLQALIGMQHGESFSFIGKARAEFLRCCTEGKEAMVVVHPGGEARAGHFVENKSLLPDSPNRGLRTQPEGDFIAISGAEYEVRGLYGITSRALGYSLTKSILASFKHALFYLSGHFIRFISGIAEDQVSTVFSRLVDAKVLQPDGKGGLKEWVPGTGWQPISFGDAMNLSQIIQTLPQSSLPEGAPAGATEIKITPLSDLGMKAASPFFTVGDQIVINPGGATEELATVAGLGSLILADPLQYEHQPGEMVSVVPIVQPEALAGDFNEDGCVDRLDFRVLITAVRGGAPYDPLFDLNDDGAVNRADARTLVGLFTHRHGAPCGAN